MHLHHTAAERPGTSWPEFLDTLRPVRTEAWGNPAEPVMKHARAQQWQAMLDGLRAAREEATRRDLPLAELIGTWAEWVVPGGRLSFPAGGSVNALDRQRPLGGAPSTTETTSAELLADPGVQKRHLGVEPLPDIVR